MFKIRTMNTISPLGTQILEKHGCEVGPRVDNPQALLIRSADLHSTEFWPELLCIGRAGAGTNNNAASWLIKDQKLRSGQ